MCLGFNYGGYPMMGSMYGMPGMGYNRAQYFKAKYGCEECFKQGAYDKQLVIPVTPAAKENARSSFLTRLKYKIFGQ